MTRSGKCITAPSTLITMDLFEILSHLAAVVFRSSGAVLAPACITFVPRSRRLVWPTCLRSPILDAGRRQPVRGRLGQNFSGT